ncbi:MAG: hypothetical protein J0L91_01270 [Burkholderiales bacterium]|nr:hypothetical protein [Burkholderiales bacterium]
MRISTKEPSGLIPLPKWKPTPLLRPLFFAIGAAIGALIGYGVLVSGPEAYVTWFDPRQMAWIVVPALIADVLAAISTERFIHSRRRSAGSEG